MPMNLVLGTGNKKKLLEMKELLGGLPLEVQDLSAFPDAPEIVEDGESFAENARKKACGLALALGSWVLGEDSGLCVTALGGRPGIFSARYCGEHGDDDANNQLLIKEMSGVPEEKRGAYYLSHVAVSDPAGNIRGEADGDCHGVISRELRGSNGFGYDPLFIVPEYHRTFGELDPVVKRALSHRSRAFKKLRPMLLSVLRSM